MTKIVKDQSTKQKGYATMEKNGILEFRIKESVSDVLNELLRDGAQQLIRQAVETELSEYLSLHQRLTDDGMVALVRNCYLPKREILTGIGPVRVRIPKVRSKDGKALTFRSALVPLPMSEKTDHWKWHYPGCT